MQLMETAAFLDHAARAGIGYDPRYPAAQSLIFLPPSEHSRFWVRPVQPSKWPHFVSTLLAAAGATDRVLLSRRRGNWPGIAGAHHVRDRTRAVLTQAIGIPGGWQGAVEFGAEERDHLVALLVMEFLETVNDLYVIPGDTRALLQFSHHDVVHVSCPSGEEIESVVATMSAAKYELPGELPDATFKRPSWMR